MLDINTIVYQLPIKVDVDQILREIETIVIPSRGNVSVYNTSISVTNTSSTPLDTWFLENNGQMSKIYDPNAKSEVSRHYSKYTLGFPGKWRDDLMALYKNGVTDKELVQWHPALINSEIYNLGERIEKFFNLEYKLRCRLSFLAGEFCHPRHSDPHTPWRVHLNLKTGPNSKWIFFDFEKQQELEWHQPSGSVWLIRTGNLQHMVKVPANEIRWQLFYHIWNKNLGSDYHQEW